MALIRKTPHTCDTCRRSPAPLEVMQHERPPEGDECASYGLCPPMECLDWAKAKAKVPDEPIDATTVSEGSESSTDGAA